MKLLPLCPDTILEALANPKGHGKPVGDIRIKKAWCSPCGVDAVWHTEESSDSWRAQ